MAKYRIEIKKSTVKEIKTLPAPYLKRILDRISSLSENPRPKDRIKLSGEEKYRIRLGVYRVLYEIDENVLIVFIIKVAHRKNIYK